MTIIEKLQGMKTKLEELEREKMKVEGKRAQLLEQLKAKGINSYEEGMVELDRLTALRLAAEAEAQELLDLLTEKYKEFLI